MTTLIDSRLCWHSDSPRSTGAHSARTRGVSLGTHPSAVGCGLPGALRSPRPVTRSCAVCSVAEPRASASDSLEHRMWSLATCVQTPSPPAPLPQVPRLSNAMMSTHVHSSTTHNSQRVEATQTFTQGRWINQLWSMPGNITQP